MGRSKLMKPEFEKDVVYLVQFPRAACLPSLSPFALKLETWLRMADIRYQSISNKMTEQSSKGQIPFVELNGRELNDTNFIIEELTTYFGRESMESNLSVEQKANLHSYLRMTEESLRWATLVERAKIGEYMFNEKDGMGRSISGPFKIILRIIGIRMIKRGMRTATQKQGYGRFNEQEMENVTKGDLKALDGFLGNKRFFMGDNPTRLDASVFGTVGELIYMPSTTDTIKKFVRTDCPNLNAFMMRVKSDYWPDWEEIMKTGSMDTTFTNKMRTKRYTNPAFQDSTEF